MSYASGNKLKRMTKTGFASESLAWEFIEWLNEREN